MNLTEPQSGSDLGTLRTLARPNGDGTYALEGQKIFITWGDHDAADNIVHFVLARLPDAPAGVKGISLFLAPKVLVGEEGQLGERNALRPLGIEHKLGIHASPTCVMAFEGARAERVGELGQGLAHMFTMMNAARLAVGAEGVAIAERAYQQALAYAQERRQGRSATGEPAVIFEHPDVRRMLAVSKAKIDAARGLCLSAAVAADLGRAGPDAERDRWRRREALLVPIAKAWATDIGVEVASTGVQVHGGMGFIEETGAAQHYRDARIAPIYEGANGIQAMDLVGRKLSDGGLAVRELMEEMAVDAQASHASPDERLRAAASALEAGMTALQEATDWLVGRRGIAMADVQAGAYAYLTLAGEVIGGWMLTRAALVAAGSDEPWLKAKAALLQVYVDNVLAAAPARLSSVRQGFVSLAALEAEALSA